MSIPNQTTQTVELVEPNVRVATPVSLAPVNAPQASPPARVSVKTSPMTAITVEHAVKPVALDSSVPRASVWSSVLQVKSYAMANASIPNRITQTAEPVEQSVLVATPVSLAPVNAPQVSHPVGASAKTSPMTAITVEHAVKPVALDNSVPTAGVWCRVQQAKPTAMANAWTPSRMMQTAVDVEQSVQVEILASLVYAGVPQVSPPARVSVKTLRKIAPTAVDVENSVDQDSSAPTAGV